MAAAKLIAIGLIAAGALALIYRGITYTRHHDVDVAGLDIKYQDHETIDIPTWAGVAAIGAGTAILLARRSA